MQICAKFETPHLPHSLAPHDTYVFRVFVVSVVILWKLQKYAGYVCALF